MLQQLSRSCAVGLAICVAGCAVPPPTDVAASRAGARFAAWQDPGSGEPEPERQDPERREPGTGSEEPRDPGIEPVEREVVVIEVEAGADDEEDEPLPPAEHRSLNVGLFDTGLSIGNSKRWNGLRINGRDHGVDTVRGINLTFWKSLGIGIEDMQGIAIGPAPSAERARGLQLGLVAAIAGQVADGVSIGGVAAFSEGAMHGIQVAGVAVAAEDEIDGITVGGIAVAGEDDIRGLQAGSIAVVAEGEIQGISVGGIAVVAEEDIEGLQLAGIASVAGEKVRGVTVAGIAAVAASDVRGVQLGGLVNFSEGDLTGLSVGGLAVVAEEDLEGFQAAGLVAVAEDDASGLTVGGLTVTGAGRVRGIQAAGVGLFGATAIQGLSVGGLIVGDGRDDFWDFRPRGHVGENGQRSSIDGITAAGLRIDANRIRGLSIAGVVNRAHEFDGFGLAACNTVGGRQRGLTIGLFNHASDLRGVQIGLLNHVPANPWWARWLPIVNARF